MFINKPGNYGSIYLEGKDPSIFQSDVALRIRSIGLVEFNKLTIRNCGMPIRHEKGNLYIHTLDCAAFTADLFNSIGNLEIYNLIVEYDGTNFTLDDYAKVHPDALGQFFNHKTKSVKNVKIHNIYARIKGDLIQGMMLSEAHDYENFQVGINNVDIKIDYPYAFVANTLKRSYINVGSRLVKIVNSKGSKYKSQDVVITGLANNIYADFDYILRDNPIKGKNMVLNTKVAIIIGHNSKSQGASRKGITEFQYWSDFFDDNIDQLKMAANANGIELQVFERQSFGRRTYGKEMRDVHSRIDQWGADISVECHYNGFQGKAGGHEVLYYNKSKGGKIIANLIDKAMDLWLDNKDRDRKPVSLGQNGSYGLKVGKARSVLIEPFFGQEINEFIATGTQRENLINTFKTFFKYVGELNNKTQNIVKKPTQYLTEAELELAMELI